MLEAFIEYIDNIYWPGYAQLIINEDPVKFQFEYNEFINNYGSGLQKS